MPVIESFPFNKVGFDRVRNAQYGADWPIVYLLEDGKEAYVGETVSAYTRLQQHYDNPVRFKLRHAHVISDPEFNKSATLDIESSLIQYLVADEKFKLQNGNGGLSNHSYYDRERYAAKFDLLWTHLQELGIAQRDLLDLRNTDIFKDSPYKALTMEQAEVVKRLYLALRGDRNKTFLIHGEAGTGKTILATYLIKFLSEQPDTKNLSVGLVVPMTSLRKTLKRVFRSIDGLDSSMVLGPNDVAKRRYDLLVVDEAHRLRRRKNLTNYRSYDETNQMLGFSSEKNELDWIIASSQKQLFLYDERQTVRPTDIRPEQIMALGATEYRLKSQMRVEGGEDYLRYVDLLLGGKVTHIFTSQKYDFRVATTIHQLKSLITEKEQRHKLSRLVAGFAWPWTSRKSGDFDIEIDGLRLKWNSVTEDWVNSPNAHAEVGCIHTVQGYDLNYVGVIIGPELSYDKAARRLVVDPRKYYDINGKKGVDDSAELEAYILNIYKTLMTRGIKGTYIYAVDSELQEYLSSLK